MSAPGRRPLSERSVKALLTRAGVQYEELAMREFDGRVIVTGPRHARRRASEALFDAGLANAPLPDQDDWARPIRSR